MLVNVVPLHCSRSRI